MPAQDIYIEKDASINERIEAPPCHDKGASERRDVIVVASVSCIYGLGKRRTMRTPFSVSRRRTVGPQGFHDEASWTAIINATTVLQPGNFRSGESL